MARYIQLERVLLQGPDLDERWVQARIAEAPARLGLGDLVLTAPSAYTGQFNVAAGRVRTTTATGIGATRNEVQRLAVDWFNRHI